MAPRPIWRGHLRLALVSCPVALLAARHERNNIHFNLINPETNNRVRMVTLDAETGEEVERGELVRGYEFKKDHYILMTEEDFDSARIESSSTLAIGKFVPSGSIDALHFDTAYLIVPDGDTGEDVYAVLREAIARSGTIALSRIVLSRRERTVAIVAHERGLVLHTLHEADDIADIDEAFSAVPAGKPDAAMVKLATELIERQTSKYEPADLEDRYEARLREIIEAKIEGTGIDPDDPEPEERGNVVDLMDALKRSLAGAGGKPQAGKAPVRKASPNAAKSKPKPAPRQPAKARGAARPKRAAGGRGRSR
ncbi:non-homologous end joining protein Ku [Elioraea rosea]|uniref:non-homologous end joining protein Ku n=1 Tax=Elioraea rosea TaxID=2492390 RepID=UPI00118449A4|nr:Ku protein [Elioraea rosea]